MGYDAISNAHVCAFAKVSSKKKRGSKLAKLKQNKFVCKSEQSCIEDRHKDCKMESHNNVGTHPQSIPYASKGRQAPRHHSRVTRDAHKVLPIQNNEVSPWKSSSINRNSGCANLGNDSHRIEGRRSITGSSSSSCSEEDRDKGCLDDWEAVADALYADDGSQVSVLEQHNESESESLIREDGSQSPSNSRQCQGIGRAWSPDDVFRPQSLPRIPTRQNHHAFRPQSLPQHSTQQNYRTHNSRRDYSSSPAVFSWRKVAVPDVQPSVCPICCEDFDVTDSNFQPCPCGYKLCLFCHHRILEVDGRCPGCRMQYGSTNAGAGLPDALL